MRLNEFKFAPKKKPWQAAELALELGERLAVFFKHKGFIKIGAGHFSNVFSNGRNVVKVYREDPAYEKFLALAAQYPSKHFPKVLSEPKAISNDLKMVQLERLYPMTKADEALFTKAYGHAMMNERPYPEGHPELEELVHALRFLCSFLDKNYKQYAHDMKPANILKRRDGTLVISDPFAG